MGFFGALERNPTMGASATPTRVPPRTFELWVLNNNNTHFDLWLFCIQAHVWSGSIDLIMNYNVPFSKKNGTPCIMLTILHLHHNLPIIYMVRFTVWLQIIQNKRRYHKPIKITNTFFGVEDLWWGADVCVYAAISAMLNLTLADISS